MNKLRQGEDIDDRTPTAFVLGIAIGAGVPLLLMALA
jgi:hypothetical protein